MKKLLLIALMLFVVRLQGQVRIDEREAFSTAESFLQENTGLQRPSLALSETIGSRQSGLTNLYVFSVEPQGFVIVSALNDVLAFSLTSPMPPSKALPSHIAYWIDLYNEATDQLFEHPAQRKEPKKSERTVEPLLTSAWGQGCYHNAACPIDNAGPCHHVEAGCVAIAMAQIMYYHKCPLQGHGKKTYSTSHYGSLTANFGETFYQWEEMADTLHELNPAVAKLILHCGISVKMQYGPNGSGAYSSDVPAALHRHFYYPAASMATRAFFGDDEWLSMIKDDLDRQRPVYYGGKSNLGGHAFVCDGYDGSGMFHFNFGWDGVADGYYIIDAPYGFSLSQSMIHDIYPVESIPIHCDSHGIIYVTPDGMGDGSSWANATSELQQAIFKSYALNNRVWVKEGIYYGNFTEDYAFRIPGNCKLHGGFKGDEPYDYNLSLRDFEAHPTILDGSHSQGVIEAQPDFDDSSILIDGFTLQNGNASQGGGLYINGNTTVRNCKIGHNQANNGGGMMQRAKSPDSVVIEHCDFFNNSAVKGGAVYDYGNAYYINCRMHDNTASQRGGGIIFNNSKAQSLFICCTICNNAAQNGGGLYSMGSNTSFWSCLFNNNTAQTGGACYLSKSTNLYNCTIVKNEAEIDYGGVYVLNPTVRDCIITNCIIWGNVSQGENAQIGPTCSYSFCAVENDTSGADSNFKAEAENDGNLPNFYVRFKNADVTAGSTGYDGDWRLSSNSLCIDRGFAVTDSIGSDLDGNTRLQHGGIDLGAYESSTATQFIDAYYCESDPYYFQDSLIAELGDYTFLRQGDPYDTLIIVQLQLPPSTIAYTKQICENETYDFFGTILHEAGEYAATVNCVDYQLTLSITPMEHVFLQEEICDGDSFDFFGTPITEAGTYSTIIGCISYQLDLSILPTHISYHTMEEEICQGEYYDFFGTILRQTGHFTRTKGCDVYELDLTVNTPPAMQCSNDTLVKYGDPVHLTASGADSYLWSTGETTKAITVCPVTDMTYTVTGFSNNGCSSNASVVVKVTEKSNDLVLFPNPANNRVDIYKPLIDEVEVYDLFGTLKKRINANREIVYLDVSQYVNGIYIVHVRCLKNHYYKKLVIQH